MGAPELQYREVRLRRARPRVQREMTSIAIAGDVRGAGRTTLAVNLAAALASQGQRVALFHHDPLEAPGGVTLVRFGENPAALSCDVALLDLPAQAQEREIADAHEVVIVLRATDDPASMEALLARHRPAWRRVPARYLVNKFDARRPTDRSGLRALRARLGGRLLDPPVQGDLAWPLFAPQSQAAADVARLARVLVPEGIPDAR